MCHCHLLFLLLPREKNKAIINLQASDIVDFWSLTKRPISNKLGKSEKKFLTSKDVWKNDKQLFTYISFSAEKKNLSSLGYAPPPHRLISYVFP